MTKPSSLLLLAFAHASLQGSVGAWSAPSQKKPTTTRQGFFQSLMNGSATAATIAIVSTIPTPVQASEIGVCPKKGNGLNNVNCVSTASVRQLENYMEPWTYPKDMSVSEVLARIKGACSTNVRLSVVDTTDTSLRVQAIRNFAKDEILFTVNPDDRVITFVSQQTEGPDQPDFGENRKRMEDLKRRIGVFGTMGGDIMESPQQGALGQLKAFYGLQSGKGFEDVFLEDE